MTQFEQGKWVRITSTEGKFADLPAKDRKAFVVRVNDDGSARLQTNSTKMIFDDVHQTECEKYAPQS